MHMCVRVCVCACVSNMIFYYNITSYYVLLSDMYDISD